MILIELPYAFSLLQSSPFADHGVHRSTNTSEFPNKYRLTLSLHQVYAKYGFFYFNMEHFKGSSGDSALLDMTMPTSCVRRALIQSLPRNMCSNVHHLFFKRFRVRFSEE